MTTKQQVIDMHAHHPEWTISQVARALNCLPQYVSATARRNGLTFPKRPPGEKRRFELALHKIARGCENPSDYAMRILNGSQP